ncbi:MAG: transporter substrate-binding domain-containing protein [Anaerolineaceae bacterium]|nr:transporter substrate-binding domain-containing protein [Anaerolineaceae bacterium]
MKKNLYSTLILLLLLIFIVVPATAQESNPTYVVAQLAKPNDISEIDFSKFLEPRFQSGWTVFDHNHAIDFQYYEDLSGMLMALDAGTVDEITLPRFVAEYVVRTNPELEICCVEAMPENMTLRFGFREDENDLLAQMNEAIAAMKGDGTLDALINSYMKPNAGEELTSVQFDSFPESDKTIRVAVTGDLPPIDYIGADGIPAGFNTAVLAEIGRRLGANIELLSMQTGSRALALTSGRADSVFWFMWSPNDSYDVPEGVLLSDSYLTFDMWLHVRKAEK